MEMRLLSTVRSTGLLFLAVFLLSVDSGVFAAPTNVSQRNSLTYAAKQSVIENVGYTILCDFCKMAVKLVQSIFETSVSENFIAEIITKACIELQIEDEYICTTITQEFKVCMETFMYS